MLRNIQSPGVEIREHDLSQYAQTLEGTYALVLGYASRGPDSEPVILSSLSDKVANFGEPTNEAERYFHYAIEEVINNGGVPVVGKLPYNNIQAKNYKAYGITISEPGAITGGTFQKEVSGAADFYSQYSAINHSAISIANEAYDLIKLGNIFDENLESYDFLLVDETKSVNGTENSSLSGELAKEGMIAVLVDPVDAIKVQYLAAAASDTDVSEVITSITTMSEDELYVKLSNQLRYSSLSEDLAKRFPTIEFSENGTSIVKDYSNHIGLMICRSYKDPQNQGKYQISVVESFVGSIHKYAKDNSTGKSAYIGDIVNQNSGYFRMYAKPQNYNVSSKNEYNTITNPAISRVDRDVVLINDVSEYSFFGFSESDVVKIINGKSMQAEIKKILEKVGDIDSLQLDIVLDAGLSTIAQFTADADGYDDLDSLIRLPQYVYDESNQVWNVSQTVTNGFTDTEGLKYDPSQYKKEIASADDVQYWRAVCQELITFCQDIRKDCMAILDVPRNLVLEQNEKYIRKTAPTNTFSNKIAPKLRYVTGLNSSYAALYATWLKAIDDYSGAQTWMPQSVWMGGIYCYTDANFQIWNDPAGLTRGVINTAVDISFAPNQKETDQLYIKSINYAKLYPVEGIVAMGQKTTQVKKSAFDRVNVRRLFLRLERYVYQVARYFVHEPNNVFTRRRFKDTVDPIFKNALHAGGLYAYQIICDQTNNPPDVIENNEMRAAFLVNPVRSAEFILCDFYATRVGANFSEIINEII